MKEHLYQIRKHEQSARSNSAGGGQLIYRHFCSDDHHGIDDWKVLLIDQALDEPALRKKESFWQYKLDTFAPKGLNERDVPIDLG